MARKVVDLPNGKVSVDGVEMSRRTYLNRYGKNAFTQGKVVSIASNPDKKYQLRKPTKQETKAENKASKQNTKILKKVDKANYSSGADAARKKAAERAKAVAPEKRTAAQTRAIKTESRYKSGLPGYSAGPVTKAVKKEDKKFMKEVKAAAKKKTGPTAPRGGGGLRGGFGMGSGGGSGRSNVNR
jgi:hypothetical protein